MSMQFPPEVTLGKTSSGLEYLDVDHPLARARIFLQGAHVSFFQSKGQAPLLWISEAEDYQSGKPLRGGIPICWPWFGAHPNNSSAPAHGFVRSALWQCESVTAHSEGVALNFRFDAESRPDWPHRAKLTYQVKIGANLEVALTTVNVGVNDFVLTQALHSYFAIGDISSVTLRNLNQCRYDDQLLGNEGRGLLSLESCLAFACETDRIYYPKESLTLECNQYSLELQTQSSGSAVVWNPWIDKSARLSNFKPMDYLEMVCVETANCGADRVQLSAGQSHTLAVHFRQFNTGKN